MPSRRLSVSIARVAATLIVLAGAGVGVGSTWLLTQPTASAEVVPSELRASNGNGNSSDANGNSSDGNGNSRNSNGNVDVSGIGQTPRCFSAALGHPANNAISSDSRERAVGGQPQAADTTCSLLGHDGGDVWSQPANADVFVWATGTPILVMIHPVDRASTDHNPDLPGGWRAIREFNLKLIPFGSPTNAILTVYYTDAEVAGLTVGADTLQLQYSDAGAGRWVGIPAQLDTNLHSFRMDNVDVSPFDRLTRVALLARS
jgi:hypothetical protein